MFFYASKIVWFVIQPSTLLLLLFVLGLLLYRIGRTRAGIRVLVAAVAIYAIGGLSPLATAMMLSLEEPYSAPSVKDIKRLDGIIVLGGMLDPYLSSKRGEIALNEAAERLTETAALAYRFPQARIVFSGGDSGVLYRSTSEASFARQFFTQIGVDPARITLESQSRNTWENAVFTKKLINPKPGERWLLVTSASHMRRAMGCFRAAGFDVTPWPVDFRTSGPEDLLVLPPGPSDAWNRIDTVTREWVGYVAYALTGRLK
jgi:uncharacterized SAM-binding protein YcdF (DUF218 family)